MRDLRDRFDTLETLDAHDLWADIQRKATRPAPAFHSSRLRGPGIAAATAVALVIVLGGMWIGPLLSAGSRTVTGPGVERLVVVSSAGPGLFGVVAASVAGGGLLLAIALTLRRRWRQSHRPSAKEGHTMETMDRTIERPETIDRVNRLNKWLIVAVAILVALLAAVGAWLAISQSSSNDVAQVVLDSNTAVNAGDVDAYLALHSEDSVFTTVIDGSVTVYEGQDELRAWAIQLFDSWKSEATGDLVVSGNYVTFPNSVSWTGSSGFQGVHIARVDDGLITERYFIGESMMP